MGSNGKSLMGILWEWELVTKLGMGMGRNGNRLHGNGREWECKKPFPGISLAEFHLFDKLSCRYKTGRLNHLLCRCPNTNRPRYRSCSSVRLRIRLSSLDRLQLIQNSLARAVVKAPKFTHATPILKSLHWLKINERIQYKILSFTFILLYTTQPPYMYDLLSQQSPPTGNSRSSSLVTLARPPTRSSLKITSRSFRYASFHVLNQPRHSLITLKR